MSGHKGRLEGRLIAVGITGSIAAYKAPELVRLLQGEGADVVALLSPSATRFVAPLTLEALTRHPAEVDVLSLLPDGRIGHIVVAHSADAIVVAPATAHWLAAMATGLAGDVVTAACLATAAPVVVAPAMDGEMYAGACGSTSATGSSSRRKVSWRRANRGSGAWQTSRRSSMPSWPPFETVRCAHRALRLGRRISARPEKRTSRTDTW